MQPSVVHIIHCIWWPLFYTSSYSPTRIYSHHRYLFLLLNIIICSKYNSLKTCTDTYYLAYLFVYHLWGTSYWWDLFMENLTKQCFLSEIIHWGLLLDQKKDGGLWSWIFLGNTWLLFVFSIVRWCDELNFQVNNQKVLIWW